MSFPDQDPSFRPTPAETGATQPKWIIMTPEVFEEGSLGREVFPQDLIGRSRPETIFDRDLARVHPTFLAYNRLGKALNEAGIKTIKAFANTNPEDIESLPGFANAVRLLKLYMKRMTITPHGRYLRHVYDFERPIAYPIPPERESEQIEAVNGSLTNINLRGEKRDRNVDIIRFFHGLNDGMVKTLDEVGGEFGISGEQIRKIDAKVSRRLMHPRFRQNAQSYLALPVNSIGRQLGFVFDRDLKGRSSIFRDVQLSDHVWRELDELNLFVINTDELLDLDLDTLPLTTQVISEIFQGFEERLAQVPTQA